MNLNASIIDQRLAGVQAEIATRAADELNLHDPGRLKSLAFVYLCVQTLLDLDMEVVAFELELEPLLARGIPVATALSRYPSVRRDLAFVVAEGVAWGAVKATAEAAAGPALRDLRLFDRYAGKGMETGFKSFAMALILQDDSRTLTDRDVDAAVAAVVAALHAEHGAVIRG